MVFSWKKYASPDPKEARAKKDREDALLKAVSIALATGDIETCQSLRKMMETTPNTPESTYVALLEGMASLNIRTQKEKLQKSMNDNRFAAFNPAEQALIKEALEQVDLEKAKQNPEIRKLFGTTDRYIQ